MFLFVYCICVCVCVCVCVYEEGMATYFHILAWRIPWTERPGGLESSRVAQSCTWLKWPNTHIYMCVCVCACVCVCIVGGYARISSFWGGQSFLFRPLVIRWDQPTLWRVICFSQPTNLNVIPSKKYLPRSIWNNVLPNICMHWPTMEFVKLAIIEKINPFFFKGFIFFFNNKHNKTIH